MSRRKGQALAVPGSADEAVALIERYVSAERIALDVRLRTEGAIDVLKGDRDAVLVAIEAEQKARFASLKAWWEAGGMEAAKGKRSAELAGAMLGVRLSPPKVKFAKGFSDKIVLLWLAGLRWSRAKEFRRIKVELDKPAIIKAVQAEDQVRDTFAKQGLTVVQTDEFFIDCGLDEADVARELAAG